MAHLFNPIRTHLFEGPDGNRPIIIEPQLRQHGTPLHYESTGVYKIYKDSFDDETELITLPDPKQTENLPDEANPDYLGRIIQEGGRWRYEGELLTEAEQQELGQIITDYEEPDV